jgi:hypothetical protein
MLQRAVGWVAVATVLSSPVAAGAAEPTPGLPATLRVLVAAVVMALLDYSLGSKRDPELTAGAFVGSGLSADRARPAGVA